MSDTLTTLQSPDIAELAKALAGAQGSIGNAIKDSANPFFKSSYSSLASVREACQEHLSKFGIAVIQSPTFIDGAQYLCTTLAHSSGQWMRGFYPINPVKNDPQGVGSAITYARRYALAAMTGVAPEDDDGNAASGKKEGVGAPGNQRTANKAIDQWVNTKIAEINEAEDMDALQKVWRLAFKHAQESGCTEDQIAMLEMQKNNRKAYLSDPANQQSKYE